MLNARSGKYYEGGGGSIACNGFQHGEIDTLYLVRVLGVFSKWVEEGVCVIVEDLKSKLIVSFGLEYQRKRLSHYFSALCVHAAARKNLGMLVDSKFRCSIFNRCLAVWKDEVQIGRLAIERSDAHFQQRALSSSFGEWKNWLQQRSKSKDGVNRIVRVFSRHLQRCALQEIKCFSLANERENRIRSKSFCAWKQVTALRLNLEEKVDRGSWLIQRRRLRHALSQWSQKVEKRKSYDEPVLEVRKLGAKNSWKRWRKAYKIAQFQKYWGHGTRGMLIKTLQAWRGWVDTQHLVRCFMMECNGRLARFVCPATAFATIFCCFAFRGTCWLLPFISRRFLMLWKEGVVRIQTRQSRCNEMQSRRKGAYLQRWKHRITTMQTIRQWERQADNHFKTTVKVLNSNPMFSILKCIVIC